MGYGQDMYIFFKIKSFSEKIIYISDLCLGLKHSYCMKNSIITLC